MTTFTYEKLFDLAIDDAMPVTTTLTHVGQGERFTEHEDVAAIVRGDIDSLYMEIDEAYSETRYNSAHDYAIDAVETVLNRWEREGEIDSDLLAEMHDGYRAEEGYQYVLEAAYERDDSDPVSELAWGRTFIRIELRGGEDSDGNLFSHADLAYGVKHGRTFPADIPATVVGEALEYVGDEHSRLTMFYFASVDLGDVLRLHSEGRKTVTFTGGALLLEDTECGSGGEAELPEDFKITLPVADLRSDRDQWGYSWDEVCGLVSTAYPAVIAD